MVSQGTAIYNGFLLHVHFLRVGREVLQIQSILGHKVVVHPTAPNKSFWLLNVINEDVQPHLTVTELGFFIQKKKHLRFTASTTFCLASIRWECKMIEPRNIGMY